MATGLYDESVVSVARSTYLAPPSGRLAVKRKGRSLLRSANVPKPIVLIDSCEQQPWPLHASHPNWIEGETRTRLKTGDYSIAGMESLIALERKSLADLVDCTVTSRQRFLS